MPDREEVIENLKKVWNAFNSMEHELYADYVFDALELLISKEPEEQILNEIDRIYRCPSCHKSFFFKGQHFCDCCGRAVKWE